MPYLFAVKQQVNPSLGHHRGSQNQASSINSTAKNIHINRYTPDVRSETGLLKRSVTGILGNSLSCSTVSNVAGCSTLLSLPTHPPTPLLSQSKLPGRIGQYHP